MRITAKQVEDCQAFDVTIKHTTPSATKGIVITCISELDAKAFIAKFERAVERHSVEVIETVKVKGK